ncbi:MAG: hypothetical protein ACRD2D_12690, partial [Terriglobales bacterium]
MLLLAAWGMGQRVYAPAAERPLLPQARQSAAAAKTESPNPPRASSKAVQPPAPDPLIAAHDLNVGTFYYNRGDYIGALARFEDAIYNDPGAPEPYCRAGDANYKLKHALPAQADWERCAQSA